MLSNGHRRITRIQVKPDLSRVFIAFVEVVDGEPLDGEEESQIIDTAYSAKSKHRPHNDLVSALKKLTAHALKAAEIELADKNHRNYTVIKVQIDGDIALNKSRVILTIGHRVERTDKVIPIEVPQITLSEESDYEDWKAVKKLVEALSEEAWGYLGGKHDGDDIQLAFAFADGNGDEDQTPLAEQLTISK
jgi:hypothetical protein